MKSAAFPYWVKWVAQDLSGAIWGFEAEPHQHDTGWYENEVGRYCLLGQAQTNSDWRNALIAVDKLANGDIAKYALTIPIFDLQQKLPGNH